MNYLSLDIGSTCCKYQVFSSQGEILSYRSKEYALKKIENYTYVDVNAIWSNVKEMIKEASSISQIDSICISTFGESFVLLDDKDNVLFLPMLYTDPRGEEQAKRILDLFTEDEIFARVGCMPQSLFSISKLLWIKQNAPNIYKKAKKVMLMLDYIGYLLTGERAIDYCLASRTGVFNFNDKDFDSQILQKLGVEKELFSIPKKTGTIVGGIRKELLTELNLSENCKLVLGTHDQICATLGAGALNSGEAADGMGTVECITAIFDNPVVDLKMGKMGYTIVPFAIDGLYCTYLINYSNASIVNWFKNNLLHGYCDDKEDFFSYIEQDFTPTPSPVMVLPYFGGAATPYQDINAKAAILNLKTTTTDREIYQAILESTAMEMRLNAQVLQGFGITIKSAVASGGGSNSKNWLKIKSNVQNLPIKTLRSSEGGLCGIAMIQAVSMGGAIDLTHARDIFVKYKDEFVPDDKIQQSYEQKYLKYKKLYKTLKEFN